jgi:hypothetical protein
MCQHQPPCAAKDPARTAHECLPPRHAGSARTELASGDAAVQLSAANPVPARRAARSGGEKGVISMPEISGLAATARLHHLSDRLERRPEPAGGELRAMKLRERGETVLKP